MEDSPSSAAQTYHWIECHHWEVEFHGLPTRIPWRLCDATPPLDLGAGTGKSFPVIPLFHAVQLYLADESVAEKDPRFVGFSKQIDLGDGFVADLEKGDTIACMGGIREMERTGHECGYVEFNKAFLLNRTGDQEGRRAAYRRGTELAPNCEMLWAHYAETSEAAGDTAEAIRAWFECLRILPLHQAAVLGLERHKQVFRVTNPDNPEVPHILRREELYASLQADIAKYHDDAAGLAGIGSHITQGGLFPDLALAALERAEELDGTNVATLRNLGMAQLDAGQPLEAFQSVSKALSLAPDDAWNHYSLAHVSLATGRHDNVGNCLQAALRCDPNHRPSLEFYYGGNNTMSDVQKEDALVAFGAERTACTPYVIAAERAWKRGERERAVRFASEAHRINPGDDGGFLTYTGMLAASGENEWVAALTRPRLSEGERRPRAWSNYASALYALGLQDEAIATLSRALAELELTAEERGRLDNTLADWRGQMVIGDITAEFLEGAECLRRSVYFIKDGKRNGMLFEQGMGTPNKRVINIVLPKPKPSFDMPMEQQNAMEPYDPVTLGCFTISGYDLSIMDKEPISVVYILLDGGEIQCAPWQGKNRLSVRWNLVPPPRHESAEV